MAGKGGFFHGCRCCKSCRQTGIGFCKSGDRGKNSGGQPLILTPDENVIGLKAVKQFIGTSSVVYGQALNLDCSGGMLDCRFNYSYRIGQKKPTLTSIEVL